MTNFEGVLFDLFETLVSEFDIGHDDSDAIANVLGIPPEEFRRRYQKRRHDRMTGTVAWPDAVAGIAKDCGVTLSPGIVEALLEQREQAFSSHLNRTIPEVIECLDCIRAAGLKMAVVSNTDGSEVSEFWNSPLGERFDAAIFSHEVGAAKPDPKIFIAACEALQADAAQCLYVGDGNSDELVAAAHLGMTPLCAGWFLKTHSSELGHDVIVRRSNGFPIVMAPVEIVDYLRMYNYRMQPTTRYARDG